MKIFKIQSGNAITRQYRNTRKKFVMNTAAATASTAVFVHSYNTKQPLETVLSCGGFAIFYDRAMDMFSSLKKLRTQYKAIVRRAKSIYKKSGTY